MEDASFAELQRLAEMRGTTVEKLLTDQAEALTRQAPRRRTSLDEALADARRRWAAIPPGERNVVSDRLKALTGILPSDIDVKKEYREHIERKYL